MNLKTAASKTYCTCSLVSQSAVRQGNRLHMNVYETRGQPARVPTTKTSGTEPKRGFRPPQHCPALAQVVSRKVQAAVPEQGMVRTQQTLTALAKVINIKGISRVSYTVGINIRINF